MSLYRLGRAEEKEQDRRSAIIAAPGPEAVCVFQLGDAMCEDS
jgi:hypothetical protein